MISSTSTSSHSRYDLHQQSLTTLSPAGAGSLPRVFWWFAEHALHEGNPISIPAQGPEEAPYRANALVVRQRRSIYRAEILGVPVSGRHPRTGAPVATIITFDSGSEPEAALKQAWSDVQDQYGARFRIGMFKRPFICVIRHRHLAQLNTAQEAVISQVCDAVGHGCLLHSMGMKPPNETIFPYISTLPSDASVIGHLLRVGRSALG